MKHVLWLLGLLGCVVPSYAQSVFAPPPEPLESTTTGSATPGATSTSPFQWGDASVRPHASYSYLYSTGVQARPGQQSSTSVHRFSPGLLLDGGRWTFDYTPTFAHYSNRAFKNKVEHAADFATGASYRELTLRFTQDFHSTSAPLIETGRQTDQKRYTTHLNAAYSLGNRTQLSSGITYSVRSSGDFPNAKDLAFSEAVYYQISPRLAAGVNLGFGKTEMSEGSDMTYVRPQVEMSLRASDKINLKLQAGTDRRRFDNSGAANLNSPTWSASVGYTPVETTSLSLVTSRGTSASYFRNQVTESTGWTLGLRQRLFQRYQLGATYSRQKTEYIAASTTVVGGRDDRTDLYSVSLGTTFFERGSVSLSYQRRENTSNAAGFGFSSNQFGFQIGYRY